MKKSLLLFVIIFFCGMIASFAQDSEGGLPPSFGIKNISGEIDMVQIQQPDLAKLSAEDNDRASKSMPYRIGVMLPVDLSINNSGTWTDLPDNDASLWRLTVKSEGAKSIGFGYTSFYLPEGAKLFLYNKDKSKVLGAYTSANNTDNYYFTNEKVNGDEVTIELFVPNNKKNEVLLHITELNYFYRGGESSPDTWNPLTIGPKASGTCEVNVVCTPEGTNWQDEKKGVCKLDIRVGSSWFNCSGSLVNNTSLNCTPYVLLADHCHYDGGYASTADYNAWVFYFHYESSTCGGTSATGTFTKTGCTLKAHDTYGSNGTGSDFCLVQINSAITGDVYYNGWDRTNTASASGVSIHHPAGDIMKISTYTTALSSYNVGGTGTHWLVYWAATTNGHGITEGGSSGSPIFNSAGNVIGTLTGGSSYCNTPNDPDYYGKLYYHWDQNGSTAAKRLKDWLDPTNTGVTSLAGVASCSSCTPPTTQATAFNSSAITDNSMTVGWTRGNGTGGVIVVARAGSAVNATPVNGTTYTANAVFGSGTQIGSGNYVVYKGTGTSVNVTGLSSATAYHFAVFEYNTTNICFKTPGLTGNATTTGTPVSGCDTLTNILSTDTLTLYGFGTGQWGTWTGHNSYSFSEFAEYYTGVSTPSITGLEVYVGDVYSGGTGGNHKVTFKVYQGGGATPGTVLGSKDVALSALNSYALNYITFDAPVSFTGTDVYVGYQIYYNSPADTFNVAQTTSSTPNSGFIKYNSTWYSFPGISSGSLNSAIYVSPIICSGCTVFPAAAGTISGAATVCQGQNSVTYTVPTIADATSYVWTLPTGATGSSSTNSITVNYGLSAVSGNITVKGQNTCGFGTASSKAIVVNSKPATPTITQVGNVLHSSATTGNQWYNQSGLIPGATSQDYTYTTVGNYYVIVTVNGCSSDQSNTITITSSGIESLTTNNAIKVYPNPVTDELIIEMKGNTETINFKIFNAIGQVVFAGDFVENTTVKTSAFTAGVYLIKLENGKTIEFKKIIKQ